MQFKKKSKVDGDTMILILEGELIGPVSAEFKTWSAETIERGPGDVEVDCSQLSYIDSTGLGALIYLRKLVVDGDGTLILTNVSGWLLKFLQVTGLLTTFCGPQCEPQS